MSTITLEPSGCETLDQLWRMQGDRIRVTWPNGQQRAGVVGVWSTPDGRNFGTFAGVLATGEFSSVVAIERMNAHGRYELAWVKP